jgi:hypothetical protein
MACPEGVYGSRQQSLAWLPTGILNGIYLRFVLCLANYVLLL